MEPKGESVPLFIDRLPFHCWIDATRTPPSPQWSIVLPIVLAEPTLPGPPSLTSATDWLLDTGNRGEAFAWRHHLIQAGFDPDQGRLPLPMTIRTVAGQVTVPVRDVDLWLVSNIPALHATPYRMVLHRGLPFRDLPTRPDPLLQRPLIGVRAMRGGAESGDRLRERHDLGLDPGSGGVLMSRPEATPLMPVRPVGGSPRRCRTPRGRTGLRTIP